MDPARAEIDVALVRRLVAEQFPQWAHLPIVAAEPNGWDNRTFRLGLYMSVRLPSAAGYVEQVAKEHYWLPKLAPLVPFPIPVPLAMGEPGSGYPWNWSIYPWLKGETAEVEKIVSLPEFARALAQFLVALQQIDATGGPLPGAHNFMRGAHPSVYDGETRRAIQILSDDIDDRAVTAVWEAALASKWRASPVWIHGDVAAGNLLIKDGRLAAVIDFGCAGIGDPACDLVIAWTLLSGESREVFRSSLQLDSWTWARGRGWALWKALITVAEYREKDPPVARMARQVIAEVIGDHQRAIRRGEF